MTELMTHPAADLLPMQTDEEFAALVELIAEHGQQRPIVVDDQGRIVDGRNRWKACTQLGIDPVTEPLGDRDPWMLSEVENGANRSLSTGQKAMRRAVTLAAQGARVDGRWKRGTIQNSDIPDVGNNGKTWSNAMQQAGQVIDVATRATALRNNNPDNSQDLAFFVDLPQSVINGATTIAMAFRQACEFDAQAALAEATMYRPITDALGLIEETLSDVARLLPLPSIDAPLKPEHKKRIRDAAETAAEMARQLRKEAAAVAEAGADQ